MKTLFLAFIMLVLSTGNTSANLCNKSKIKDQHRTESKLIRGKAFSPATPDYLGKTPYNSWVLACNRDRDTNGQELDKKIDPDTGDDFKPDLAPVIVKGKYNYYGTHIIDIPVIGMIDPLAGATTLKYRYRLRRENSEWIVTLPIFLDFPLEPLKDRMDITLELAVQLGLMSTNGNGPLQCDRGQQVYSSVKQDGENLVDTGFVTALYGPACRLSYSQLVDNTPIMLHYLEFWKQAIQNAWNRPNFRVEVLMVNQDYDPISPELQIVFDRDNVTWVNHLTLNPDHRPRFRPGFADVKHMYTGLPGSVIAHEAGHYLGLDDEYREKDKKNNDWRDCSPQGGSGYLMCSNSYARPDTIDPSTGLIITANDMPGGITTPEAAKGIYAWIISRRYAVGKPEFCKKDHDCESGFYCNIGLDLVKNSCLRLKNDNEACAVVNGARTCKSGNCRLGRCYTPNSVEAGGLCYVNDACISDRCTGELGFKGVCVCNDDNDCSDTKYCDMGLDFKKNSCRARKADNEACALVNGDRTCLSGNCGVGRCFTPKSVSAGGTCYVDDACKAGKCSSIGGTKGSCVCDADKDCDNDEWCDKGFDLHQNSCKAKIKKGEICGTAGELSVGHRCKSGKCKLRGITGKLECK